MLSSEHAIRTLVERLNWPVRFARWQAATELAGLLSSSQRELTIEILLEWLRSREFETEVVAGLTVLLCAKPNDLPSPDEVRLNIKKPSILADLLFQRLYKEPLGGWLDAHSGAAPLGFSADRYFEEYNGQVIPRFLSSEMERLQRQFGLPFPEQWAFEWRNLMDATHSPHSTYPYHFVNAHGSREGMTAQLCQAQCNVYRSAYLRTFAFAVSEWGMPSSDAALFASFCLPLSSDIHSLKPIGRPTWLGNLPERCCESDAKLENFARRLTKPGTGTNGMRPVSLRIPVRTEAAEFGELSIESFYVTDDFVPDQEFLDYHRRLLILSASAIGSLVGQLPNNPVDDYRIGGKTGWCVPMTLDAFPVHQGYWQNDYSHMGFAFPAPYIFNKSVSVESVRGFIGFASHRRRVGYWKMWHDNWVPAYPVEGRTRCGGFTELRTNVVEEAAQNLGMSLAWHVTLRRWERAREYGEPQLKTKSTFFRD